MAEDIKVNAKAEKIENDKTKSQAEAAKTIKKKQEEAKEKALKAQEESKTKTEEKVKEAESKKESNNNTATALATAAVTALGASKTVKSAKSFVKGLLLGLIIGGLVMTYLTSRGFLNIGQKVESVKEEADTLLDETFLGYTAADFQDAVLGAASEHKELIVMEQPLEVSTTLTKAGLANLEIFSKTKTITYHGTGVYTVDLNSFSKENINVDEDSKTVTITIPHAQLQYINPDLEATEFEDTEKGLLAFGDLSLTTEQQNELQKAVEDSMREELEKEEILAQADEFAKLKTWELFQPLVSAVSPEYVVQIEISD